MREFPSTQYQRIDFWWVGQHGAVLGHETTECNAEYFRSHNCRPGVRIHTERNRSTTMLILTRGHTDNKCFTVFNLLPGRANRRNTEDLGLCDWQGDIEIWRRHIQGGTGKYTNCRQCCQPYKYLYLPPVVLRDIHQSEPVCLWWWGTQFRTPSRHQYKKGKSRDAFQSPFLLKSPHFRMLRLYPT